MTPALWFIAVVAAGVTVALLLLQSVPGYRSFAARRFGHSVWLAMPDDALLASVERRVARKAVAGGVGGLAALAIMVTGMSALGAPADEGYVATWVIIGGYFAGIAVGSAINALTEPRSERAVTFARAEAVELCDFVAPVERQGARVVVLLAVLLGAVLAVLTARDGEPSSAGLAGALVMVALALVSLVVFEIGSRRVLSRGRPAGSPTELAWDDALRAGALRDLVTAPLALGTYSLFVLGGELANGYTGAASAVGFTVLIGIVVAGFAALVVVLITRPQRYYLRRLWPELAGTQDAGA
jgi:hypothetical protein